MKKEWPLFEIFIRSKNGLEHRHVGSLHAADPEMVRRTAAVVNELETSVVRSPRGRNNVGADNIRANSTSTFAAPPISKSPVDARLKRKAWMHADRNANSNADASTMQSSS